MLRKCPVCRSEVTRPNKIYCTTGCRQKGYRLRKGYYNTHTIAKRNIKVVKSESK